MLEHMNIGRAAGVWLLVGGLSVGAAAAGETATVTSARPSALVPIPNARVPLEGVLSGGQPSESQIRAVADAGFRTVINLRTPGESGFGWEPDAVENAGMVYVSIPVAGAQGLTRDNVDRIADAVERARRDGPVLLHCASGNRIGAVFALKAAWLDGVDPQAALEIGLRTGLTGLEPEVRRRLGLAGSAP